MDERINRLVAGVFIERHRVTFIGATYEIDAPKGDTGPSLTFSEPAEISWDPEDTKQAISGLREAARKLGVAFPEAHSIAIASFGPFVSLSRNHRDYGVLSDMCATIAFKDVNLKDVFESEFRKLRRGTLPLVTCHTDATAIAVGEAMARNTPADHVMVAVLVTEGIGGGIVVGRDPFKSALHPEMGLLHPRFDGNDIRKPPKPSHLFSGSISDFADNVALRAKYRELYEGYEPTTENLAAMKNTGLWKNRGYYVAQLCFSCTVILAPHSIVLAADIDPGERIAHDTRESFNDLLRTRQDEGAPVLDYPELDDLTVFISPSVELPYPELKGFPKSIALTAATGMCLNAARARSGDARSNLTVV